MAAVVDTDKKLTPIKAIRAKCLDCSNYQTKEVRLCPIKKCALYRYRMGHRPKDDNFTDESDMDEKNEDTTEVFYQNNDGVMVNGSRY